MPYSRAALEAMPRSELQNVCKLYGFKANESNRKIIDNILAKDADEAAFTTRNTRRASKLSTTSMEPQRQQRKVARDPQPAQQDRRVTRSDAAESDQMRRSSTRLNPTPSNIPTMASVRKSKAAQSRLGVGRPTAVGGTGPRTATKRQSTNDRSRRATVRRSRAVKNELPSPVEQDDEDTEEDEPSKESPSEPVEAQNAETQLPLTPAATPGGPSSEYSQQGSSNATQQQQQLPTLSDFAPFHQLQGDVARLSTAYQALKAETAQLQSLQAEVRNLRTIANKLPSLESELAAFKAQANASAHLQKTVDELRAEVAFLKDRLAEAVSTTPNTVALPQALVPSTQPGGNYQVPGLMQPAQNHISTPAQILGKRQREETPTQSPAGDMLDNLINRESGEIASIQEGLHFGSPRKRSKTHAQFDLDTSPIRPTNHAAPLQPEETVLNSLDFASIFNFTESRQPSGSNFAEPSRPSDLPIASLPFPIVASPSAHIQMPTNRPHRSELVDRRVSSRGSPFKRPSTAAAANHFRFPSGVNGMFALPEEDDLLSTQLHSVADRPMPSSIGVNPAQLLAQSFSMERMTPAGRTLYGTELDGDTRFGEFGVDGVANEFWKAPGFL